MSYDVKKVTYQEVEFLGKPALFSEHRLDSNTVPGVCTAMNCAMVTRTGVSR